MVAGSMLLMVVELWFIKLCMRIRELGNNGKVDCNFF